MRSTNWRYSGPGREWTDCLAVLDAADVDAAHLVNVSMGGLIAQGIALTAPERVRSLCLIATHPGIAHAVTNSQAMAKLMQLDGRGGPVPLRRRVTRA